MLKTDTSIIDNGQFDLEMHALRAETVKLAIRARACEGDSRDEEHWPEAFSLWREVYVLCKRFDDEFYLNKKVLWAKRKWLRKSIIQLAGAFVAGVLASVIAGVIMNLFSSK